MNNLQKFNTFKMNVNCNKVMLLRTIQDFEKFQKIEENKLILGEGSDVLLTSDFDGIVGITTNNEFSISEDTNNYIVHAQAGVKWHSLVTELVNHNIGGTENLALIPGCCGAAPIQNIGAYGVEFKQVCGYINVIDREGKTSKLSAKECNFGYRSSNFKTLWRDYIITSIELHINKNWVPALAYEPLQKFSKLKSITPKFIYEEILKLRMQKLPNPELLGNAGSFFKNPTVDKKLHDEILQKYPQLKSYSLGNDQYKLAAGWLIEQCGLKGFSVGDAQVYEKQALVLVNKGKATPQNIIDLARHVIETVHHKYGVTLEPEIRIYGRTGEIKL